MSTTELSTIVSKLTEEDIKALKKSLPQGVTSCPEDLSKIKVTFPAALKKFFGSQASNKFTEWTKDILNRPLTCELEPEDLTEYAVSKGHTKEEFKPVEKSRTTNSYLEHITQTRIKLEHLSTELTGQVEKIEHNVNFVVDMTSAGKVFIVKVEQAVKKDWSYHVLDLFMYGSLCSEHDLYIVFPIQEYIWHYDMSQWSRRKIFRDILLSKLEPLTNEEVEDPRSLYVIGHHVAIEDGIVSTITNLPNHEPSQIFFGAPQTYTLSIRYKDINICLEHITSKNITAFVHSPYLINLCTPREDNENKHMSCLLQYLRYASAIKCKGVVVHVGASTKRPLKEAYANMLDNVKWVLDEATEECPLLLETPAGEGTEMLTEIKEFVGFVKDVNDSRLKICVDTCHVYASGIKPSEYLTTLIDLGIIPHLIHFNDSMKAFGSRVDRHARIGEGMIGLNELNKCAHIGYKYNIPMIIE